MTDCEKPSPRDIEEALSKLREIGLVRDTGKRRPGPDGRMEVVWDVAIDRSEEHAPCPDCGHFPVLISCRWTASAEIDVSDGDVHLGHMTPSVLLEDVGVLTQRGIIWTKVGRVIEVDCDDLSEVVEDRSVVAPGKRVGHAHAGKVHVVSKYSARCLACDGEPDLDALGIAEATTASGHRRA